MNYSRSIGRSLAGLADVGRVSPMMTRKITPDGWPVAEYNFLVPGEAGRAFLIKPVEGSEKWSLWFWNRGHRYLLTIQGGLKAKEFNTPEACVTYCRGVTEADAAWSDFRLRGGFESIPVGLGDEGRWLPTGEMPAQTVR